MIVCCVLWVELSFVVSLLCVVWMLGGWLIDSCLLIVRCIDRCRNGLVWFFLGV